MMGTSWHVVSPIIPPSWRDSSTKRAFPALSRHPSRHHGEIQELVVGELRDPAEDEQ